MKKEKEKPSKIKIDLAFDKCKDSVNELLNGYKKRIDECVEKMAILKSEKRFTEAERYREKLKLVLSRQSKMLDLLDQVENFQFMIDEAFAKNVVYNTFGSVLNESNKINMAPEVRKIVRSMNKFEKGFKKDVIKFNNIFGKISKSVTNIDNSSITNDSEIDNVVNNRLKEYDEHTSKMAEEIINNNSVN